MEKLILFIKTYRNDFDNAVNLLKSIDKFNVEKIPVVVSVNDADYDFFKERIKTVKIIKDSDVVTTTITDPWRYQQIIKANVYKLNLCKNYLCIDSDSEFIRDFHYSDFLYDDDTPYTIMHESKPFLEDMEKIGLDSQEIFFKQALNATRDFFENKGKDWDYGPSPYLWSTKVWESLVEEFLKEKNMSFEDLFLHIDAKTPPSECVIYGEYLLKTNLIKILPVEGFFKVYHYKKQFDLEKKYHNINKLKKIYMGIIYQSNWKNKKKKFIFF